MTKEIHKCSNCDIYTLEKICPKCNKPTLTPKPAKFNPNDKFGSYRRLYKKKHT